MFLVMLKIILVPLIISLNIVEISQPYHPNPNSSHSNQIKNDILMNQCQKGVGSPRDFL